MNEYTNHLDFYSNYWFSSFSKATPESVWGNRNVAAAYLKKYWLFERDYIKFWKPTQNQIFTNQNTGLPELVFNKDYSLFALRGGVVFIKEEFEKLQKFMLSTGDNYFVVIQNSFGGKLKEPAFRMKYPANISWKELMSGNFVSSILFEMFHNEYFVFGNTGYWGRYCANDYKYPINIMGFKKEYKTLFTTNFRVSKEERREIYNNWVPDSYKKLLLQED